jgi:hypothetical protein
MILGSAHETENKVRLVRSIGLNANQQIQITLKDAMRSLGAFLFVSEGSSLSRRSVPLCSVLGKQSETLRLRGRSSGRKSTALLLILGSSPMVEGIPAFFAAGKYGIGLIVVMAVVFAISTIATYVLLCVYSTAGLQRVRLGPFERYGEVLSGAFIALVGLAFWIWPVL